MRYSTAAHGAELAYYAAHGMITDPGVESPMLAELPSDVEGLCRVGHGVMIHLLHAQRYRVKLSEPRKHETHIRRMEQKLARIRALDPRPICDKRPPARRVVGTCRDYAVLLCCMLREQSIPARVRAGFATYFPSAVYEDHWICEYWNRDRERWSRVDAQLDAVQLEQMNIDLDPLELPDGAFLPAGQMWRMVRGGEVDPELFTNEKVNGLQFVHDYVVRDIMALGRIELLPWDPVNLPGAPGGAIGGLVDILAVCSLEPDEHFDALQPTRELLGVPTDQDA